MAYRRPGVTVTQEFADTVVALVGVSLPCVAVGPAYQLVSGDSLGSYAGSGVTLPFLSLMGGAFLDTDFLADDELFPITKRPISVTLKNTYIEVLAAQVDGHWNGAAFTDPTSQQFASVLPGDIVSVVSSSGVSVVAAQTNGSSFQATGQKNRLVAGTVGQFVNVEPGDTVVVTGASPSVAGTFFVESVSGDTLLLDADINDGTADSTAVNFVITGNRGSASAGDYPIKSKTNANTLVLQSALPAVESLISYSVKRKLPATATAVAGQTVLPRLVIAAPAGFTADETGVILPVAMTVAVGTGPTYYPVVSADVYADYRALRTDLASEVKPYTSLADVTAVFGVNQVAPANPLAFGIGVMLQNTVTEVSAIGLDDLAVSDEVSSFTTAAEVLSLADYYANAVLSHNPVVHQLFNTQAIQLSDPNMGLERVALFNSRLPLVAVMQEESTTVTTANNSRVIVNTQLAGGGAVANPTRLVDASSASRFHNVLPGDTVVVQAGTGVTAGSYLVQSKISDTQIVLASSFITSGSPTDIQYYIIRLDGLGADGLTFYDRNASFLAEGVAAGQFLKITSGALAGRYKIGAVQSDKQLTLAVAIPGVATNTTSLTYVADRDLSKNEQALLVAGYSESFGSRRSVHCWPDSVLVPVGQTLQYVPGFYLCCSVAALCTGLPSQQGFTNLSVGGFLGFKHSTKYFSDTQLNTIANGGTMIFAQDGAQQPLYIRHQLTTNRAAIKFQELSFTKNVDFAAKFLRSTYKPFIGPYNIIDTTFDALRTTATSAITFLKERTRRERIGGVIKTGELKSLAEDPSAIDSINAVFGLNFPIPLNNLNITIVI